MARALATIDVNGLAGHEARRFQIEDGADDVRDLAHPAKRVQLGELRMRFDGMHRRLDDAGRHRIHSDAALCVLDRQRLGRGTQASLGQRGEYGRHIGVRVSDQARRDLHDVATLPLLHLRDGELRDVKKPVRLTLSTAA